MQSPFRFNKTQVSPGFLLWQTTVVWQRLIKRVLEPQGVSHAQLVIMALLLWFELHELEATQTQIVHWSKLDKMTVSKALRNMETQDLVQRLASARDSRAKTVLLTLKGKMLVLKLIPQVEKVDADFFETLQSSDQQHLIQLLRQLPLVEDVAEKES